MKILAKIRAFFKSENKEHEIQVSAAEIRGHKVFLHPLNEKHTVCINASDVDILINPTDKISKENIRIIGTQTPSSSTQTQSVHPSKRSSTVAYSPPPMKTISMRLYMEEYEMLMNAIQTNGYRKTEYLLACVTAAKKNSLDAAYKQFYNDHQARRKAVREAVRQAKIRATQVQQVTQSPQTNS